MIKNIELDLIHYGSSSYDKSKFNDIANEWVKPKGGLWASPVDSDCGWKEWCEREDFRAERLENYFKFKFKGSAFCLEEAENFRILREEHMPENHIIDFEKMLTDGVDAIYLTAAGYFCVNCFALDMFNGVDHVYLTSYDCESIIILNKESIFI